jgi:type IX secretion system PorP/SprF family membrane protein
MEKQSQNQELFQSLDKNIMKKLGILIGILLLGGIAHAQTVAQYTQWNQNHYLVNPAAAGNQNHFDVATGFRKQWSGIKDAPQSFYATGHTVLNRPKSFENSAIRISESSSSNDKKSNSPMLKHAAGAKVNSSQFGAFEKVEAMLTYALHLPVTKTINLSFGLSAGLNNYSFNSSEAQVLREGDPVYDAYVVGENSNKLNVNSGTYLYSDKFFVGYAAHQLLQNNLEIADIETNTEEASLELHHFIMGGYNFDLTNDFRLTPSVLIKKLNPNPVSVDVNATLTYKQAMYVGLGYRNAESISAMVGYQVNHFLRAGYAYDFLTSDLNQRAGGSHEIFIGLTLF